MRKVTLPDNFNEYNFTQLIKNTKFKPLKLRYRAMQMLQNGYNVTLTSNRLQISARMIHRWIRLIKDGGIENLKDKEGRGRRQILKNEQLPNLLKELAIYNKSKAITGEITKRLIKKIYGYEITLPTAYNILKRLNIAVKAQRKYNNYDFRGE